jgi:hypothetical protein
MNKFLSEELQNEIMLNLKNLKFKWTKIQNNTTGVNLDEIIKENQLFTAPWKLIFRENNFNHDLFGNVQNPKIIKKEKFNLVPFTFSPVFPYKNTVEVYYFLKKLNITAFQKLEKFLGLCVKSISEPLKVPEFLLMEKILEVKRKYRKWTITICDKNSNLQLPMCPRQYYNDMCRTFIENKNMFKILANSEGGTKETEKSYLGKLQKIHKKQWSHLGNFKKCGQLPRGYTLPKFTDIDKKLLVCRVRPIITYAKFAMKKTLSIVAIGLNFLISMLDPSQHFDLNDSNLVKGFFEKINENTPFGHFTGAVTLLADIETMFDKIEPGMVKETLEWLFTEIRKIKRTDRLAVDFRKRKARFGRSYGEQYEIKYQEIIDIVQYMLNNSYVKIGCEHIATQIKGLPQGAPPSPPLARLVCIKREWAWRQMITVDSKLLGGMRFMDDIYMLFFYNINDKITKEIAKNMKKSFREHCFFPQWNLKENDNNVFLSTETKWECGAMNVKWHNKNKETIEKGTQKIIRFIHSKSYTSETIKSNSIYSQFLRVTRNSDKNNIMNDLDEICKEYQLLGYRKSLILLQRKRAEAKIEYQEIINK